MIVILKFIYSFITDGLWLILISAPFYIFFRTLFLKKRRRKNLFDKYDYVREIIMFAFFMFLVLLFVQTFIVNSGADEINLIPFAIIVKQIKESSLGDVSYGVFVLNILGNILIFSPIGFFSAYLFKTDFKHTIFLGFLISLVIEGGQLPLSRTSDVDDLILNTLGALIGYIIFIAFKKVLDHRKNLRIHC